MTRGPGAAVLLTLATSAPGCSSEADFAEPPPRSTLGEAVYQITHDNLARSTECTAPRLGLLEGRRDDFVRHFDGCLTEEMLAGLPDTLANALLPHVDDGAVLELARVLATRVALLVDDGHDPSREALAEVLSLLQTPTVLDGAQLLDLVDVLLARDDLPDLLHLLAQLGGSSDRGTWVTERALQVAAGVVELAGTPIDCTGLEFDQLGSTLLDPNRFEESLDFGEPAWSVRADSRGYPRVRVDPVSGFLSSPFVDRNQDGEADLDAAGRAVDSLGQPIHLPPFGEDGDRDEHGRALAADGKLVYDYYDTKRTGASVLLQFLGEALAAGWHRDVVRVALSASPPQIVCPGDDCLRFPDDNPVADLAFAVLEDLRYDRIATLLKTWDVVTRDSPDVAEQVLVSVGRILEAMEAGGVRLTDRDLIALLLELMPLIADVYASDNTSGASTPRLLLEVIHELGDVARDFPPKLQTTIDYVTLHKEEACSETPPDLTASTPVDFSAPRRSNGADNRSGLEQTVELLSVVDCGEVPFTGGKTVAELVIDTMADSSPETACSIIELSLAFLELAPNLSESVGVAALNLIGCPGEEVWQGLQALDGLAKSGVLEAYLPIAAAFVARQQVRTLLDIFRLVAADLRAADEPGGHSAVRRLLPALSAVAERGGIDALFDLVDLLVTVRAVDGSGTMADIVVDSFDYLFDDRGTVRTRRGDATGTSVGVEMIRPYLALLDNLEAAGDVEALDRVIGQFVRYLASEPGADGVRRLTDRRVLTNINNLLGLFADSLDLTREQRDCWFEAAQELAETFLTGEEFATAMRIAELWIDHPDGARLDALAVDLLDPHQDGFGPLLQLVTAAVQLPADVVDLDVVLRFAGDVLEPRPGEDPTQLLVALDEMLLGDEHDLVVTLARNLLDRGASRREASALEFFAGLGADLLATSDLRYCADDPEQAWTLEEIEAALETALAFVLGDDAPLPSILSLIAVRRVAPEGR